jgi:catechol 2,3-dioxygenase
MASIAPQTTVGAVHLTVADLDRSQRWYAHALGLDAARDDGVARLSVGGTELLVLYEERGAQPVRGHTGLYHYALLVPERSDLARWLAHVAQERIPLTGLSDHFVSEAIYLRDPDGHGIEIYRDRPRERWEHVGNTIRMGVEPLDVEDLLATLGSDPLTASGGAAAALTGSDPWVMPQGTRMGHVHLHVADLGAAAAFYRDALGFDEMARLGDQALFLSAGGYHHHIGTNTWAGHGATPPPPGSAALRHATIVLPDAAERDRVVGRAASAGAEAVEVAGGILVRDPSENALLLTVA